MGADRISVRDIWKRSVEKSWQLGTSECVCLSEAVMKSRLKLTERVSITEGYCHLQILTAKL